VSLINSKLTILNPLTGQIEYPDNFFERFGFFIRCNYQLINQANRFNWLNELNRTAPIIIMTVKLRPQNTEKCPLTKFGSTNQRK
jgi:hypothetical protein